MIEEITPVHTITIAMLNVSGINTSLDLVINYLETHQHIDILLLTETFLLQGELFSNWIQHHNYSIIHGNARNGSGGISFLIKPTFPYHVHALPTENRFTLSIVIGSTITLHGFYLPPSMPYPVYQNILSAIDFNSNSTVICFGDFNSRLGQITGDTKFTNPRGNFFRSWLATNQVQLWNSLLTPGEVTFENQSGSSIIDYFISKKKIFQTQPDMYIESKINLNSDHHLLTFTFNTTVHPKLLPPKLGNIRRLWKLQRLEDPEIHDLYQNKFFSRTLKLRQEIRFFIQHQHAKHLDIFTAGSTERELDQINQDNSKNFLINLKNNFDFQVTESPQEFIERIGTELEEAIHLALDESVTPAKPRQKNWKFFWDADLQQLANTRQECYNNWKICRSKNHAKIEDIATAWANYQDSSSNLKKAIKASKRRHWKKFCTDMHNLPSQDVYPILKKIRKKNSSTHKFSHSEGPKAAADAMATHLRSVFGGDQTNMESWRASRKPLYTNFFAPDCFSTSSIKVYLNFMASRKAPGKDSITKEMLVPVWYPLCQILSDFFTLCYTWAWTPSNYRSAMVIPIYKKGDHTKASNYRPICLTTTLRKLYERCIQGVLLKTMPALDVAQGGFRASRGSIDQTLNLIALQQQFKQLYDTDASLCLLDISQAYDSIERHRIWNLLKPHLPKPLFFILRNLFNMVTVQVINDNATSFPLFPKKGVLQGSILSPFLYAVFINELPPFLRTVPTRFPLMVEVAIRNKRPGDLNPKEVRDSSLERVCYGESGLTEHNADSTPKNGVIRQQVAVHLLLYADDVCIIAHRRDMPLLIKMVEEFSLGKNFRWNPVKSALINYHSVRRPIKIYDVPIPLVESYDYLGVPMTATGIDVQTMINNSVKKAKATMMLMRRIGVHQYGFGLLLALKVYRVFVRPAMEFALAILGLNATTSMALEKAQAICLNMTLNLSAHHNAPSSVLNMMACIPSMYTRAQILAFKFTNRLNNNLPPYTLLSCLKHTHAKYQYAPPLWKRFEKNKLWRDYKLQSKTHPTIKPHTIVKQFIEKEVIRWRDNPRKVSCKRAYRGKSGYDPILYYPCTRKERFRLTKWRLHWLPSFPVHACRCGAQAVKRVHYLSCPLTQPIVNSLIMMLPETFPIDEVCNEDGMPLTHILDRVLNHLPTNLEDTIGTHWEYTWPLALEWLNTIDFANHPEGHFPEEEYAGDVFRDYVANQTQPK